MKRDVITILLACIVTFCIGESGLMCAVNPNPLFADNAVLQRGISVPIWGEARDGELVTVSFREQKVSAVSKNGHWMVHLRPMSAGGPFTMTITGDNAVEIKNILVGEVWLAGGQSNMQTLMSSTETAQHDISVSDDPMLRVFSVPVCTADHPKTSFAKKADLYSFFDMYCYACGHPKRTVSVWEQADKTTTGEFSGVAYYFARQLRDTLHVPVGIIESSLGGTTAESWTNLLITGTDTKSPGLADQEPNRPGHLFNGMIAPVQPYGIRGAIWYQGESEAMIGRSSRYESDLSRLIRSWRESWGQGDFPFLMVQIAPFGPAKPEPSESTWAEVRQAQLRTTLTVPHTAMAVITDSGSQTQIHPVKKAIVGERLALGARAIAYKEKLVYSGPIYKSVRFKDGKATIRFSSTGSGLLAKDGELKGFAIAGEDHKFVWAKAYIDGNKVVAYSPSVQHPTVVRYGWADYLECNLFNKEGLPASPFQTDAAK